jgi:DNA invertase Pin-like site-specific DNA recombinase
MTRGRPRKPTAPLADDYLAGNSIRAVAAKHHVSRALVRRALTEQGVERRPADRLNPEHDLAIIRLRDDFGLAWTEISAISGVPTSTLQRRYAKATQKSARPHTNTEAWQSLANMYNAGKTVIEIAAATGIDPKTIRRNLRRGGIDVKNLRQVTRQKLPLSDEDLRERHATGETYQELAAICGASPTLIWRRVNFKLSAPTSG